MVDFSKNKWRAIIHFLFIEGKPPTEGTNRMHRTAMSLEEDPRSGASGEDQVTTVCSLLDEDCRLTFEEIRS